MELELFPGASLTLVGITILECLIGFLAMRALPNFVKVRAVRSRLARTNRVSHRRFQPES